MPELSCTTADVINSAMLARAFGNPPVAVASTVVTRRPRTRRPMRPRPPRQSKPPPPKGKVVNGTYIPPNGNGDRRNGGYTGPPPGPPPFPRPSGSTVQGTTKPA